MLRTLSNCHQWRTGFLLLVLNFFSLMLWSQTNGLTQTIKGTVLDPLFGIAWVGARQRNVVDPVCTESAKPEAKAPVIGGGARLEGAGVRR